MVALNKLLPAILFLCCFCSVTAVAAEASFAPGEKFITVTNDSADKSAVAKILGISADDLNSYMKENNVVLLAVDGNNKRQIRLTEKVCKFSKEIKNFSLLSDSDILSLAGNLSGSDTAEYDIVSRNEQKFLKARETLLDSGGSYVLTQYITVAGSRIYNLSFCTSADCSDEYIKTVFESLDISTSPAGNQDGDFELSDVLIPAAIVSLMALSCVIAFTLICDFRDI